MQKIEQRDDGTTKYYYFGQQRVAVRNGDELYYLHGDHLGSTSLTTCGENCPGGATTGDVVSERRYHPFGLERYSDGTHQTDFGYTGQRDEAGFGLYDYRARYYDPLVGRFISPDPIVPDLANSQDWNRYAYVRGNPLKYIDPSGNIVKDDPFRLKEFLGEGGGGRGGGLGGVLGLKEVGKAVLILAAGAAAKAGFDIATATEPETEPEKKKKKKIECCSPTPTPRPTEYVADSNIFMDRIEGGASMSMARDRILQDPDITLYVPAAAVNEVLESSSQHQINRLNGLPGGATVIQVPDGDVSQHNINALRSGQFGEADIRILQTAKERNLSLLTTNEAMRRQINSDPNYGRHPEHMNRSRYEIFGSVPIKTPKEVSPFP